MKRKIEILTTLVLAAGVLAVSSTGCELLATVDRSQIPGAGGNGGAGGQTTTSTSDTGTGGTTTTSSVGGGTGTTSTSSTTSSTSSTSSTTTTTTTPPTCGTPGGQTCEIAGDCPAAATCKHAVCDTGNCCAVADDANGTTAGATAQTPGNCQVVVCDGSGGTKEIPDDSDTPADANDCSVGACVNGAPAQNFVMQGVACASNGGQICDGAGACVQCLNTNDCTDPTKPVCNTSHACVAATCTDGLQSGFETDVDCGGGAGSGCSTCADGKHCVQGSDCGASSICKAGVCTAVSCTDGVKDGAETDLDCGGTACVGQGKTCANGKICAVGTDCASGYCPASKLCTAPTCVDGAQNGAESDVDCGGTCATKCALTQKCNSAADCASGVCDGTNHCAQLANGGACTASVMCTSGNCVDGFCCNAACSGTCEACSAAKNGATDGSCLPVALGQDPDNECATQSASTCGTTGVCNGARACQLFDNSTVCAAASCGAGPTLNVARSCDGSGTCGAATTQDCTPYNCANGACPTSCAADGECVTGRVCSTGSACIIPAGNGAACAADKECAGGHCYATGGVGSTTCHSNFCADGAKNGTETDVDCGGGACPVCANGKVCTAPTDCLSGTCAGGLCTTTCTADSQCSSGMCYAGACVANINGCNVATATDLTGVTATTVTFASLSYSPRCIKVKAGTDVTFSGSFTNHPFIGGDASGPTPATTGPFTTVVNTGSTQTYTLSTVGTFPYYCVAHVGSGMMGTVFVVP